MKFGKTLQRLAGDPRVKYLNLTSDDQQVNVELQPQFVSNGKTKSGFRTAHGANDFIRNAIPI